jgi:hypothetical protein
VIGISSYFNEFDYENKSFVLKAADFCNQGLYALFHRRRVKLYQDHTGNQTYTPST